MPERPALSPLPAVVVHERRPVAEPLIDGRLALSHGSKAQPKSTATTQLYDRRRDEFTLHDVERIVL